jgi:hypothetical protein
MVATAFQPIITIFTSLIS